MQRFLLAVAMFFTLFAIAPAVRAEGASTLEDKIDSVSWPSSSISGKDRSWDLRQPQQLDVKLKNGATANDLVSAALFVDGVEIRGASMRVVGAAATESTVTVRVVLDPRDVDHKALAKVIASNGGAMTLAIGTKGGAPLKAAGSSQNVTYSPGHLHGGAYVTFVLVSAAAVYLLVRSKALRDFDVTPPQGKPAPYSLARCLAAIVFITVVGSWLCLSIRLGSSAEWSDSALALLSIATGTLALGYFVDSSKLAKRGEELAKVESELAAAGPNPPADLVAKQADLKKQIEGEPSVGPLVDTLQDGKGAALQRVIAAAVLALLCVYFLYEVFSFCQMPNLDENMLLAAGISSGAYGFMKIPEKKY